MTKTVTRQSLPRHRKDPAYPHVQRALSYARAVVAGRIPVCRWVRLACQRHLDDLRRQRSRTFPFRFDRARAERSCRFAELFPHVKGHWAIPQRSDPLANRIRLSDWQCFVRCCLRGWVEKTTGFRRFRVAYLETPRKNGKSIMAAIEGLESFAADGEPGAEIYSGATTEKQAWEVFRPARQMAEKTPEFLEHYGVEVRGSSLLIQGNGSRFEPVIGKPGDGASPSMAIVDEYHEHPDSTLYDTMITGMGARRQPLMLVITTAGTDLAGPCYALRDQVCKMLEGTQPNERLWGAIWTLDEGDDWTTDLALRKANPNYGVSVSAEFLRDQQRNAIANAREQAIFKTKHLNVWVTARDAWMNMEWWTRQADPALRREAFAGLPCFAALDIGSKSDLTPTVLVFRKEVEGTPHFYAFARHYCPRKTVEDPRNRHYQGWVADGWMIPTDGNSGERLDLALVIEGLRQDIMAAGGVESVSYDEWNAVTMEAQLGQQGLTLVAIPQTTKAFSETMKELEALVRAGQFHHDGDPCFAWQISNVTVREDANENIFPRKERPEHKIDAAVALIMAMSRALLTPIPSGPDMDFW